MANLHHDQPASEDQFQRKPFAKKIAYTIASSTDPAPLVIAISGVWGEGKTTVFGFLKTELESRGVVAMAFNPWRYPSEDELLKEFFINLANGVDDPLLTKGESLTAWARENLGFLGSAVQAVAPAGTGEAASGLFSQSGKWLSPTIDKLKYRLAEKLELNKKRVVVLLDDSDRLDQDELFALFRMVKLTADFKYVTFVLAMDYDAVANTVSHRFKGQDDQGRKFLEKIVQVPIRLPAIPYERLRKFTYELVERVLDDLGIDPIPNESARFRGGFDSALMPLIRTPRAAKQYANVIRFGLGLLPGEVNAIDIMLLEGIRIFIPKLFDRIVRLLPAKDPDYWDGEDGNLEDETQSDLIDRFLEPVEASEKAAARRLLVTLFPTKVSSVHYDQDELLEMAKMQRVALDDYFFKYLSWAIPHGDVPDTDIEQIFNFAMSGNQSQVQAALVRSIGQDTQKMLIHKLRRAEGRLSESQRECLALSVAMVADRLDYQELPWQSETAFGQAAIFSAHCLRYLDDIEKGLGVAAEMLTKGNSLIWLSEFFEWLKSKKEGDSEIKRMVWPQDVLNRLAVILANRILQMLEATETPPPDYMLKDYLWHCVDAGFSEQVRIWSRQQMEKDRSFFTILSTLLVTWSYGDGKGKSYKWPADDSVKSAIQKIMDVDWVTNNIESPPAPTGDDWHRGMTAEQVASLVLDLIKRDNTAAIQEEVTGQYPV